MTDGPRRTKTPPPPETPKGYRSSRRGSKALKQAKRAEQQHRMVTGAQRTGRRAKNFFIVVFQGLGLLLFSVLVLLVFALAINTGVRWHAKRAVERSSAAEETARRAQENLVVIGVEDDEAVGFLALRVDAANEQVYGIAIPDGAFLDIPGQGFDRIGEAFGGGPDRVTDSISNFLTVPFRSYVVVPASVYRDAIKRQVVLGIPEAATGTNLTQEQLAALSDSLGKIPQENVALVPMPVKPIKLGDQTYFEPQKEEVADLLKAWWQVDPAAAEQPVRVVVYNGAGKAGIAGEAAQELIRSGLRVIDTQNADSFDYETTRIIVRRGDAERGRRVQEVLGVGSIEVEPTSADVTDVVVIIGKDYAPRGAETGKDD